MNNQHFIPTVSKAAALSAHAENTLVRARIAKAVLVAIMEEYVESPEDVASAVFQSSREALGEALNFLYSQADNTEDELCAIINGQVSDDPDGDGGDSLEGIPGLPPLDDEEEWTE